MRMTVILRVLVALLLVGAGLLARSEARRARTESVAWQELVTLQFDKAASAHEPAGNWLTSLAGGATEDERRDATVAYWQERYDDLVEHRGNSADPDVLFVAANAAFRAARRDHAIGPDAARRLDPVLQAYGNVLKAAPQYRDAAYNYEFVVRLRDQLVLLKQPPHMSPVDAAPRRAGPIDTTDLPVGLTVHGLPGSVPPEMRTQDFEILTPKDQSDRESAEPGQARGGTVKRKG